MSPGRVPLDQAWRELGRDLAAITSEVSKLPRDARVAALRGLAAEAKKLAKALMARHHPDRGGDPARFMAVQAALESVEAHTEDYARKAEERAREAEERAAKRGPFIKIG